jgi:hypothetical protein
MGYVVNSHNMNYRKMDTNEIANRFMINVLCIATTLYYYMV